MKINPKLNLNKTPSSVENGSLVLAKNIKASTDLQYITQEEGLESVISFEDGEKIVGVIPCNKELVMFTSKPYTKKAVKFTYNDGVVNPSITYIIDNLVHFAGGIYQVGITELQYNPSFWNEIITKVLPLATEEPIESTYSSGYIFKHKNISYTIHDCMLSVSFYNEGGELKLNEFYIKFEGIGQDGMQTSIELDGTILLQDRVGGMTLVIGNFDTTKLSAEITESIDEGDSSIKESNIYRYNEETKLLTKVPTGWQYQNGEINGDYTYNVNKELIIAFGEKKEGIDIPLKTINLDTSKSTDTDDSYSICPELPQYRMDFNGFGKGQLIRNGTYYFFIRFEITNETWTQWHNIGIPIVIAEVDYKGIIAHSYTRDKNNNDTEPPGAIVNDLVMSRDYTSNNPTLTISLNNASKYLRFEIGYVLTTENATVCRTWRKYIISENSQNTSFLFDATNNEEYSLDDMIKHSFNIFNVGIVTNYENRLYIADYKESQRNIDFKEYANDITVNYESKIITSLGVYPTYYTGERNRIPFIQGTKFINQTLNERTLLPNQIYNFFVHYVRADGTSTNGTRINNSDYNYNIGNTIIDSRKTISELNSVLTASTNKNIVRLADVVKLQDYKICSVFNTSVSPKFGYYENNKGEGMFKTPSIIGLPIYRIVPIFNNVKIPDGYIGCFFTYEEVEDNVVFAGLRYDQIAQKSTGGDDTSLDTNGKDAILALQSTDVVSRGNNYTALIYDNMYSYSSAVVPTTWSTKWTLFKPTTSETIGYANIDSSYKLYFIDSSDFVNSDDRGKDNQGKEYYIKLNIESTNIKLEGLPFKQFGGQAITINENLYVSENKTLVALTGICYKSNMVNNIVNESTFGLFNCNSFVAYDSAIAYSNIGIIIADDGAVFFTNVQHNQWFTNGKSYAASFPYWKYSKINTGLRKFKIEPETIVNVLNYKDVENAKEINLVIRPQNQSELYEISKDYDLLPIKQYTNVNYDRLDDLTYTKIIRRSNVIQSESLENAWRRFEADAYKVVTENKGDITNIVGLGLYLMFHTEHSFFMFNRENQLTTEETVAQLNIPDPFDIQYVEIATSDKGYAGLQDKYAWFANEFGYFFFDNDAKRIYNFDNKAFQVVNMELSEFIHLNNIDKVRIGYDFNNQRLLFTMSFGNKVETVSYNLSSKAWLSMHDYTFYMAYHTKQLPYYLGSNKQKLFNYSNNKFGQYNELGILRIYSDINNYPVYIANDLKHKAYFDIICNFNYELFKYLESISYICSERLNFMPSSEEGSAESDLNRFYSGNDLFIYTDTCKTKYLDIDVNNYPAVRFGAPFYDRGIWNFNCFRNATIYSNKSDDLSMIYGKYIVARFIIDNELPVKFENVTFYVSAPMNV